jgi:ATP/maltotriose-dependent transcriptional regulator MalT
MPGSCDPPVEEGSEFLSILSDDIMVKILVMLSSSPSSTRGLSRVLGVGESSISRRLKSLERLGIVEGRWVSSGGVNVKLYYMKAKEITIRIDSQGITVSLGRDIYPLRDPYYSLPVNRLFIGRKPQLEFLRKGKGVTFIVGMAGIGKTSLAAEYARAFDGPVLWNMVSESTTFFQLIRRISLFLAALGDKRILESLNQGYEDSDHLIGLLIDSLSKVRCLIVIDDYHNSHDDRIKDLVIRLSKSKIVSRILVISRKKPEFYIDRENMLVVREMSQEEAKELVSNLGIDPAGFGRVYAAVGGIPQLLILYSEAVKKGLSIPSIIEDISEYIAKEILDKMPYEERLVLELLSIVRRPSPYQMLKRLGIKGPKLRAAVTSLERSMLIERIGSQYYVNDMLARIVEKWLEDPEELHRIAAEFFSSSTRDEDLVEAIYHYIMGGDLARAASLMVKIIEPLAQARISLKPFEKILRVALDKHGELNPHLRGWACLAMGVVKKLEGLFGEALEYLYRSEEIGSSIGDQRLEVYSKIEGSIVLRQMGRYGEALKKLEEALSIARDIRDRYAVERILYNIAVVSFFTGNLDSSENYFRDILPRLSRSGDRFREALTLGWLGMIYRIRFKTRESLEALDRSSKIFLDLGAAHSLAIAYREVASTHFIAGNVVDAIDYLERASALIDQNSYPHLAVGIKLDMSIYKALIGELEDSRKILGDAEELMRLKGIEDPEYRAILAVCRALNEYADGRNFYEYALNALELIDRCGIYRRIFIMSLIGVIMANTRSHREEGQHILSTLKAMLKGAGVRGEDIEEFLDTIARMIKIARSSNKAMIEK